MFNYDLRSVSAGLIHSTEEGKSNGRLGKRKRDCCFVCVRACPCVCDLKNTYFSALS